MKYIKSYETIGIGDKFKCTIDIEKLTKNNILKICKNLMKFFPSYHFSQNIRDAADINPIYIKLTVKEYKYINLSQLYTFFEKQLDSPADNDDYPIVDGNIFLKAKSKEELMQNIELYLSSNKYNL